MKSPRDIEPQEPKMHIDNLPRIRHCRPSYLPSSDARDGAAPVDECAQQHATHEVLDLVALAAVVDGPTDGVAEPQAARRTWNFWRILP
jgi:hypothetical protein